MYEVQTWVGTCVYTGQCPVRWTLLYSLNASIQTTNMETPQKAARTYGNINEKSSDEEDIADMQNQNGIVPKYKRYSKSTFCSSNVFDSVSFFIQQIQTNRQWNNLLDSE